MLCGILSIWPFILCEARIMATFARLLVILIFLLNIPVLLGIEFDPYKLLGVGRTATQAEIKKAYKQLAREWHPDKNKDPKAEDQFIQISKAYEILSNDEKRLNFDKYGDIDGQPGNHQQSQHHFRSFHKYDSFFFDESVFNFQFNSAHDSFDDKYLLHFSQYMNEVVPDSYKKPYLIKVTSDWCFSCIHIEPIWKEVVQELEPLGVGIGVIDSGYERQLLNQIGVYQHPTIVGLISGRVSFFKNAVVQENLRQFVENLLSNKLLDLITDRNYGQFLSAWEQDNKPHALIFHQKPAVPLLYKLTAFQFKDYVAFGYVETGTEKTEEILTKYNINRYTSTITIFKENIEKASDVIQAKVMKRQLIDELVSGNKFLLAPRLTNQRLFEELCPVRQYRRQKRYCVLLITGEKHKLKAPHNSFISFASVNPKESLRFAYVYSERQQAFINALLPPALRSDATSNIVILQQSTVPGKVFYKLLENEWNGSEGDKIQLFTEVNQLLEFGHHTFFSHEAILPELNDEFAPIFLLRWLYAMRDYALQIWESGFSHNWREMMPLISLLFSVVFILLGAFIIQAFGKTLVNFEEIFDTHPPVFHAFTPGNVREKRLLRILDYSAMMQECSDPIDPERGSESQKKEEPATAKVQDITKNQQSNTSKNLRSSEQDFVEVTELTYVNYMSNLVRLMPGNINVLVAVTDATKNILIQRFAHEVYPVTWNKSLHFSFLNLSKHRKWLDDLLEYVEDPARISDKQNEKHHKQNYTGYVLALNGHRKYFCLFKPKLHKEVENHGALNSSEAAKDGTGSDMTAKTMETDNPDQHTVSSNPSVKQTKQLLNRLNLWMDRLLEGIPQRYYVPFWPELH